MHLIISDQSQHGEKLGASHLSSTALQRLEVWLLSQLGILIGVRFLAPLWTMFSCLFFYLWYCLWEREVAKGIYSKKVRRRLLKGHKMNGLGPLPRLKRCGCERFSIWVLFIRYSWTYSAILSSRWKCCIIEEIQLLIKVLNPKYLVKA